MAGENNFYLDVAQGHKKGYDVVHKFGRNIAVGTSFVPVCIGGVYQTPQPASATALRVKAGNTNDTSDGSGARTVFIQGLDANGDLVSETLTTAGTSAGANSVNSYIRLFRAYVATSGTYANASAGSHAAAITIENAAGSADWLTIDATDFPKGQSEVGAYTIPNGYKGYIKNIHLSVDSGKTADVVLFKRASVLDASAPYDAMRVQQVYTAVTGEVDIIRDIPLGPYVAGEDVGFMAQVASTTSAVAVEFDIILVEA